MLVSVNNERIDFMYKKIKLPYDSLKPIIIDEVLNTHYNNHYGKYVDNLNNLVGNISYTIKDILIHIEDFEQEKR